MKKDNLYVDIHVVQTVPPSCVNRDDTGSPKTAVYGGATRARVSSQSWKHAMRVMFRDILEKEDVGFRTKHVKALLSERIALHDSGNAVKADEMAEKILVEAGLTGKKNKELTDALFFISDAQIEALATLTLNDEKADKKKTKKALEAAASIDMALFGRMVAADPSLNYDAAAQVAHAISTHSVHNEYDYFTAVDDCASEENAGAAHLDTVEYNSATLYRYATVNVRELFTTLGNKTADAVEAFMEAFIYSMPTGKQNTFANRTLPDMVYITIRNDQPVNLVGAFEQPVSGKNGYVMASVQALAKHAEEVYSDFACKPFADFSCGKGADLFGEKKPLPVIFDEITNIVKKKLEE